MPTVGRLARRDVPICNLSEPLALVEERMRSAGTDLCLVVNHEMIVLGLLRGDAWAADPVATVEQVMEEGPATTRPDSALERDAEWMQKHERDSLVVTDSDGRFAGVLYLEDAERALQRVA